MEERIWKEQEAALVAHIEHRTKEVEQLLDEALRRLMDTQTELSRHRGQETSMASETFRNCIKKVKLESLESPANMSGDSAQSQFHRKPQLFGEDSLSHPELIKELKENQLVILFAIFSKIVMFSKVHK